MGGQVSQTSESRVAATSRLGVAATSRLGVAAAAFASGLLAAFPASGTGADDRNPSTCVVVEPSSPYGAAGYNHVVTIRNGCNRVVECAVTTDVNPDAIDTGEIPPGATIDLVTFRNSPAYAFTPIAQCRYAS